MTQDDLQQLATSLLEAMNAADWERCAQLLPADAIYEEKGTGLHTDSTEVMAALRDWKARIPDAIGRFSTLVVDQDSATIASEIEWVGTYTDGRNVQTTAAFFVDVVDGRISGVRHYVDGRTCSVSDRRGALEALER